MISRKVTVNEEFGLHARPVMKVVQICRNVKSKVEICRGCVKADGCSMIELLLLEANNGTELEIVVNGDDEIDTIKSLKEFYEYGSGI
jgi:phosphotransferase system HPr (HPr) family protein